MVTWSPTQDVNQYSTNGMIASVVVNATASMVFHIVFGKYRSFKRIFFKRFIKYIVRIKY